MEKSRKQSWSARKANAATQLMLAIGGKNAEWCEWPIPDMCASQCHKNILGCNDEGLPPQKVPQRLSTACPLDGKLPPRDSVSNIHYLPPNDVLRKKARLSLGCLQSLRDKMSPSVSIVKTVFGPHIILTVMYSSGSKRIPVSYITIFHKAWKPPEGRLPTHCPTLDVQVLFATATRCHSLVQESNLHIY